MVARILNCLKGLFKSKPKRVKRRFISDDEFNSIKKSKEDKMNAILDKISKTGWKSLTEKEKDFLNKY